MYHYTDQEREKEPHSLPNVETFHIGTLDDWKDKLNCYLCSDWASEEEQTPHGEHVGWYYAHGFPDCLWDSDPVGPFKTEQEALKEAREAAGF